MQAPDNVELSAELAESLRARNAYASEDAELLAKKEKSVPEPKPRGLLSNRQAKRLLKVVEAKYGSMRSGKARDRKEKEEEETWTR